MALPLIGTAKSGAATNGGDVTLTFDTGAGAPRTGDIVVLFGGRANSSDAEAFGPITAGYTAVATINSTGPKFGVWYKVMGGTPDTQVQGEGGGNTAHAVAYGAYVLDGTLVDAAIFDATATSTGQVTAVPNGPAITTVTDGAWVITHYGAGVNDTSRGAVTNYTLIVGNTGNDTDDISIEAVYRELASHGAEDPGAWSTWSSAIGGGITIAIRPAAPIPSTGSGSPVATLSKTASGTASQKFNASGTPTKTLSAFTSSASATQKFNASGAAVATLSPTATGTAGEQFTGSGAATATLDPTATGAATMTPDDPGTISGSGAPTTSLGATATGIASQTFSGTGIAVATLSAFASGTATMTPGEEEPPPPKKKKGRHPRFIYQQVEELQQEEQEQREIEQIIEAEGLPDLPEMPQHSPLELNRAHWQQLRAPIRTQRARTQPQRANDDEEAFLHILLNL